MKTMKRTALRALTLGAFVASGLLGSAAPAGADFLCVDVWLILTSVEHVCVPLI